jgi:anti-sigma B factor antagonist
MLGTGGAAAGGDPIANSIDVSETADGVTVLALAGELDIARTPRLQVAINEVLRARPSGLVIDLCAVTFVDSTALALLLNAQRRATGQGIALQLACDVATTLQLLSLTRLDREFQVHPGCAEAIRAAGSTA